MQKLSHCIMRWIVHRWRDKHGYLVIEFPEWLTPWQRLMLAAYQIFK